LISDNLRRYIYTVVQGEKRKKEKEVSVWLGRTKGEERK
jgi:hypothetical protein